MPYERIPYTSFLWKFGTTSFRTKEFNRMTEWQLKLLKEFWNKPENADQGWERKYMAPGQADIYEIKNRYYDWLVENEFTRGDDAVKYKAAREKTSGLYDMGLINENHRLTEVGERLLSISEEQDFFTPTELGISKDSLLYLNQLLKLSYDDTGSTVRPFIIVLYLISELDYLTLDEFRYLMPLCTDEFSTSFILEFIRELRENDASIDEIIIDFLMSKPNYREGLERFCENDFSEELLLSVGMNRKSADYDRPYVALFDELYAVYMEKDLSRIVPLFTAVNRFTQSISIKWKRLLFDTSISRQVRNDPEGHLLPLPNEAIVSDVAFREFFFKTMHLFKAKATLEDYLDLNRRYLGLTNCFIFDDNQVTLDVVPKSFFNAAISDLYEEAYTESDLLFVNTNLRDICPALVFNEEAIISGINATLGTSISTIQEAYNEVERIRYDRFRHLLDNKFSDEQLLHLLDCFDNRSDSEINNLVTDNADIPTIFEYVLGIIWYKISEQKGRVLDYLKLSLDANLLPITHAAGGEADIVYEYDETDDYPVHSLLLEATLADSTNQRRMEMEPVSRHLGNHLLRTHNLNSYCVFATTYLHVNVISDFLNRKTAVYYDPQNEDNYVKGMKIIPIETSDLRCIIENKITYSKLYGHFDRAYQSEEMMPRRWHDNYVKIDNSNLINPQS
jgi:hypothetical protein